MIMIDGLLTKTRKQVLPKLKQVCHPFNIFNHSHREILPESEELRKIHAVVCHYMNPVILFGKPEHIRPLARLRHKWYDNIKMVNYFKIIPTFKHQNHQCM